MSTTVIASRLGLGLYVAPVAGPAVDIEALRRVLAKHGLAFLDSEGIERSNEFVAARGLDIPAAAALSEDLRRLGLQVRTVHNPMIRRSQRVGNAIVANMVLATSLVTAMAVGSVAVADSGAVAWYVGLAVALVGLLWVGVNLIQLNLGASQLPVAGHLGDGMRPLTDDVRRLEEHLPSHLVDAMSERAQMLERAARSDPTRPAAKELVSLRQEVRGLLDGDVLEQADTLREEVQRARLAMAEVRSKVQQ